MKNRTRELREDWTIIMSNCYSRELSACPKHPIFQPGKAINLLLKACKDKGLAFIVGRELPEYPCSWRISGYAEEVQQDMLKAGYKPTEEIEIED